MRHLRSYKRAEREVLQTYTSGAALKEAMLRTPTQQLYVQNLPAFDLASYYASDPWVRSRLTMVESREEELRWRGHDTLSLTAEHMRSFTGFRIVPYMAWKQQPGEKVMVVSHGDLDWMDGALNEDGAVVTPLGTAMGGDVVAIRFK